MNSEYDEREAAIEPNHDTQQLEREPSHEDPPRADKRAGGPLQSAGPHPWDWLMRRLYTSNPFYIISAGLVFWGLRVSFHSGHSDRAAWALLLGLEGYSVVLALTAVVLIRWARVWDDARSLLVLLVVTLVAISVTMDDRLTADPSGGRRYFAVGFAFAVAISLMVLRGSGVRLPLAFRGPYLLFLALFYGFPVAVSPLLRQDDRGSLPWVLTGFSACAGCVFLTLLPAARLIRRVELPHDCTWQWPWYPWTGMGALAFCAAARAWYVCISLHWIPGRQSIFHPVYWTPLALCVLVVALESALATGRRGAQRGILLLVWPVLGLGFLPVASGPAATFFDRVQATLGCSPQFASLLAALVLLIVARLRGAAGTSAGLAGGLAALSVILPQTNSLSTFGPPQGLPLGVLAVWQLAIAIRHQNTTRAVVSVAALVAALVCETPHDMLVADQGMWTWHVAILAQMVVVAWWRHRCDLWQQLLASQLLFTGLLLTWGPWSKYAVGGPAMHAAMLLVISMAMTWLRRSAEFVLTSTGQGLSLTLFGGLRFWRFLKLLMPGWDWIGVGLAFFAIALLVSLQKAATNRLATASALRETPLSQGSAGNTS